MSRAARKRAILLTLLAAAVLLRIYLSRQSVKHMPVTSEQAIAVLQAREFAQGRFELFTMAQPYRFPAEAYLMAPLANLLPSTALGARLLSFGLAFVFFALAVRLARRYGPLEEVFPGLLLVLFPSAYLLMILHGYNLPGYTIAVVLWLLAVLAAYRLPHAAGRKSALLTLFMGFCLGMAFTTNMGTIAVGIPLIFVVLLRPGCKRLLLNASSLAVGLFVGLLPYIAGFLRYPESRRAVTGGYPLPEALGRLLNPAVAYTLPGAMGVDPTLYPDFRETIGLLSWLRPVAGMLILLILAIATVRVLADFLRNSWKEKFPVIPLDAVLVGAAWLSLLAFAAGRIRAAEEYRYLVPFAMAFPFLVITVFRDLPAKARPVLLAAVLALAVFNVANTRALVGAWKQPDFAAQAVGAPDLSPVIEWLEANSFNHAVASYCTAYRLTLLSDERITAAQPLNERFRGWPVPYKAEVDAAERAAYVLTPLSRFLRPDVFMEHMREEGVKADMQRAGDFYIFYDFERAAPQDRERLPPAAVEARSSDNPAQARYMLDGNRASYWRSSVHQQRGMNVELRFERPVAVRRVELDMGKWGHHNPRAMILELLADGEWRAYGEVFAGRLDRFVWRRGRPQYGRTEQQTIRPETPPVDGLRFTIEQPREKMFWTLADVRVYEMRGY